MRLSTKLDELVRYGLMHINMQSLRKIKHNNKAKLFFYNNPNSNSDIIIQYNTVPLIMFSKKNHYTTVKSVRIGLHSFELKKYDRSDFFNLSTVHDIEVLKWLKVCSEMITPYKREVVISPKITDELVIDAYGAYHTQYCIIDQNKYSLYRGR